MELKLGGGKLKWKFGIEKNYRQQLFLGIFGEQNSKYVWAYLPKTPSPPLPQITFLTIFALIWVTAVIAVGAL